MSEVLWSFLSAAATLLTGTLFVALLVDGWRFSKKRTYRILVLISAAAVGIQAIFFRVLDLSQANLAAALLDVVTLSLAPVLAHWQRGRLLFSMAVTYSFTFSTVFISHLLFDDFGPGNLAVRLIAVAFFFLFLHRWFAPCLHNVFHIGIGGWYSLSLLPLLFGLMFFILIAGVFTLPAVPPGAQSSPARLFPGIPDFAVYCVQLILPPCAYIVLYQFFQSLLRHYAGCRDASVLDAQVAVLRVQKDKMDLRRRQDLQFMSLLRSRLKEVGALVRRERLTDALALSQELEGRMSSALGAGSLRQYAADPILDAVLSAYAAAAEEAGIRLSVNFALPERPVLDPAALAVVLSNALENAVCACRAQAEGRPRSIRLFTKNTPEQFFLQIENTCDGPVTFDSATGYPAALRAGHGYGTRSIAAFARQNGGSLRYAWRDGVFQLQLLI